MTSHLSFTGRLAEAKLGWVLVTDDGTHSLEFAETLAPEPYAGQQVNVTGEWVTRDAGPVFIFTPEMQRGEAPIPSGIPISPPANLADYQTRRVLLVKTISRL